MIARQRLRQGVYSLLSVLIATGMVFVGVGGLEGHAVVFAAGVWLDTLGLMALALLSRNQPAQ